MCGTLGPVGRPACRPAVPAARASRRSVPTVQPQIVTPAAATERLLVVSNRLPLTIRRSGGTWQASQSAGGLVAALGPLAQRLDAQWIGWAGDAAATDEPDRRALLDTWERDRGFVSVDLSRSLVERFYDGYCNSTLWPLLHGFPTRVELDPGTWQAYREANQRFADAVVARARPDDLIWVHDYQLALVPALIRERLPQARIGFFLHVPFPSSELFRILPDRDAFLHGLLGADLVAFQTHANLHDFRRSLLEVLGLASQMDRVDVDGRAVAVAAAPIGIVVEAWDALLRRRDVADRIRRRRVAAADPGIRTIIAVDRLDDTKGIPERLRAFRALLRGHPEWLGRVQLVQVAVPSRERVPRYAELRRTVSELVGEINGELATVDWTPIVYLRRSIEPAQLAALYATADVGWVAPLRDGMNLVAKEFVACQADGSGVLVLSEFAGAAQELAEAMRVNPYDAERSAETIVHALTMPEDERRQRETALLRRVRRNDAAAWAGRFLDDLRAAVASRAAEQPLGAPPLGELRAAARAAAGRVLYLDYDGTLVSIAARPAEAVPTPVVLETLRALTTEGVNDVILLSGRPWADLEAWFGSIARLWLVAEHGAVIRDPGTREWRPLHPGADPRWKDRIRPTLERFADRAPGSFVEEKEYGLAWHYRLADPEYGPFLARELLALLDRQLAGTDLMALIGRKVVEVRFSWANKGDAGLAIRSGLPAPAFELAIGDDRTDEDLFERLPAAAWTIHVGRGSSRARYRIGSPAEVLDLLASLASPGVGSRPAAARVPSRAAAGARANPARRGPGRSSVSAIKAR
ncbi:MAG TPA: bifunctional alpha,alpha-trehalose-phosphate synthase (UDP-forming)/trehalose-phosphatase [Candidatus Limnocylindrales bacterium]